MVEEARSFSRRYPRRGFRRHIGILCSGQYWLAMGEGIGEGGVGLITDQVISEGKLIVVTFPLPNGGFICVQAQIRTIDKKPKGVVRLGCMFLNMPFEAKRQIRAYVSARPEKEMDVV